LQRLVHDLSFAEFYFSEGVGELFIWNNNAESEKFDFLSFFVEFRFKNAVAEEFLGCGDNRIF